MEKFHIMIKNKETDEILVDTDTCAIIGAFDDADEGTGCMGFTSCNAVDLAATASGALKSALRCMNGLPTGLQDEVLKRCGLKRRNNFPEKLFGSKTNDNNN